MRCLCFHMKTDSTAGLPIAFVEMLLLGNLSISQLSTVLHLERPHEIVPALQMGN